MEATNEQLRDLLIHLDKVHSFLANTDAKDIIHAKDLDINNNNWRNFVVALMRADNKHPTEQKFPEMTTRFREIQEEMYRVFLDKNNDYSRWNILATGLVGITTRFWDKTARIMNLVGFNIGTGEYSGYKDNMVRDEKIEQTFLDASVYGIIARIFIEGKWGK